MKCPRCQREVNDENQFCPYCGQRLNNKDEQALKEYKRLRRELLVSIFNRILNISTFVAVIFAIIGIFGPILIAESANGKYGIGGLSWFSYEGWIMLNDGRLSVGPFYTTFVLYIISFILIVFLSSHAIYKAINSLKRKGECSTIPHMIALSIIQSVYSSIVNNFYYEYIYRDGNTFITDTGWGDIVYSVALPFFIIALIVLLIVKAVMTGRTKTIVSRIFVILSSFLLTGAITSAFICLGVQDFNLGEQDLFGTLHYFDIVSNMSVALATSTMIMFILGMLFIGLAIAICVTSIRNLVKYETINRPLFLALAICIALVTSGMLVDSIIFSIIINYQEGFYDNYFYLSEGLLSLLGASYLTLGFAIAIMAMGKDKPVDESIIDVEVIDKEE